MVPGASAMGESEYLIRPYAAADRQAVRRICAATAWLGAPAPERIGDEWIWAEYWTRFFTDRQKDCCWVVETVADGHVVGYLTGTPDVGRFERHVPFLMPGIVWRVIRRRLMRRRQSRRALLSMLAAIARGELALPPGVRHRFPATFHFNLLPDARGRGVGSKLLQTFIAKMRSLGVAGVHARPLGENSASARALRRAGFRLAGAAQTRAFAHVDPRPVEIHTWVLPLR